jgi:uncharacterized protein (DUF305 family)
MRSRVTRSRATRSDTPSRLDARRALLLLSVLACVPVFAVQAQRLTPAEVARRDGGRPPYTAADVAFMSGMIGHHAQAVVMSRLAPTNAASRPVQILAERIAVAQQDEIAFMQRWLRERDHPVPSADVSMAHGEHAGHGEHGAMMPGMLTASELAQLQQARGAAFDRLFLTLMIKHHAGALTMVDALLASPGAAQDDDVYKFVADVNADQDTEIARMRQMLEALAPPSAAPSTPRPDAARVR